MNGSGVLQSVYCHPLLETFSEMHFPLASSTFEACQLYASMVKSENTNGVPSTYWYVPFVAISDIPIHVDSAFFSTARAKKLRHFTATMQLSCKQNIIVELSTITFKLLATYLRKFLAELDNCNQIGKIY